jgi:hypothetical protein
MQNFNDRESYLAAVAMWKEQYKALIVEIRAAKLAYKDAQRAFAKCKPYTYSAVTDEQKASNKLYWEMERKMQDAMSTRASLRSDANDMLTERADAKIEAQKQYQRARETC